MKELGGNQVLIEKHQMNHRVISGLPFPRFENVKLRMIAESHFTDPDFDLAELEVSLARVEEALEESE